MPIHSFPIGPLGSNAYVVENGKDAILVDAPDDFEPIMSLLREKELTLKGILCTHLHFDHISGVDHLQKTFNIPSYAGQGDIDMKDVFFGRAMTFGMPQVPPFDPKAFTEGEAVFGTIKCQLISTPGHSPGGFCFYFPEEKSVLTGDTLFRRSVGRSDLPGGNNQVLMASIKDKLYTLPQDTKAYPGHERPTSIGEEMKMNPYCPA